MVKIRDIKARSIQKSHLSQNNSTIWGSRESLQKTPKFIVYLLTGFVILNAILFYSEGKLLFKNMLSSANEGLQYFNQAKTTAKSIDFAETKVAFDKAELLFKQFQEENWLLTSSFDTSKELLSAASLIAESGKLLSDTALSLQNLPEQLLSANNLYQTTISIPSQPPLAPLAAALQNLQTVSHNLSQISSALHEINTTFLPSSLTQNLKTAKTELTELQSLLAELTDYLTTTSDLLGMDLPHTYLILIQNNHEIRASGGFLGTLVFAEVDQGILTQFNFKDIYDIDGVFTKTPSYLPPEFKDFNQQLWIRDANYSPNFPTTANRINTLLQRANSPSSDTIIAIDQSLIHDLLTLTRPIPLTTNHLANSNKNQTETPTETAENHTEAETSTETTASITADNYFTVLTYLVEANKGQNTPDKQILAQFLETFKQQLFQNLNILQLLPILSSNLQEQHLQIYSRKPHIQKQLQTLNLSKSFTLPQKGMDFLSIINTSIGGNKTDRYIEQRYLHSTHFKSNGQITNTLTIRKFHSFTDSQETLWKKQLAPFGITELVDYARYILGRGDNITMTKVYVPNNSKLISVSGLPATEEVQKFTDPDLKQDYFLFKTQVKPGQIKEVSITYDPNLKFNPKPASTYQLQINPQAGTPSIPFEKTYSFENPNQQTIFASTPKIIEVQEENTLKTHFYLNSEKLLQAVYGE